MKFLKESGLILIPFLVVFLWQQTILSQYTIQTLVILVIAYLILTGRKKTLSLVTHIGDHGSVIILMTIVLLLVFATGGLTSNWFFLLYFLLFGITFAFDASTVFIFIIFATLIFLPLAVNDDIVGNFLHIGSLFLVAPIAFFFGREVKKDEKKPSRKKIKRRSSRSKKRKK